MDVTINSNLESAGEIVLSERVVTNEFKIVEIHESVRNRFVRVEVELGPFVEETNDQGEVTNVRGSGMRGITVWQNEAYDAIRDTWRNDDLIAEVMVQMG